MRYAACFAAVIGLSLPAAASAQIFRCQQPQGVALQQSPCAGGERVDVKPWQPPRRYTVAEPPRAAGPAPVAASAGTGAGRTATPKAPPPSPPPPPPPSTVIAVPKAHLQEVGCQSPSPRARRLRIAAGGLLTTADERAAILGELAALPECQAPKLASAGERRAAVQKKPSNGR